MSIGWSECLLIFFVVLLLFGAKRIPDIARSFGGATRAFKEGQEGLTKALDSVRERLLTRIQRAARPDSISVEDGLALIAVVGRGMVKAKGTAARVFMAISNAGINIRMIDQGSSELNIIIGVEEHDLEKALTAIYNEFVK